MSHDFLGSRVGNTTSHSFQAKRGSVNEIKSDPLHCERSCSPVSNDSAVLDEGDGWIVVSQG
jgi:hypothetical protein